jgi:hypothetical protein
MTDIQTGVITMIVVSSLLHFLFLLIPLISLNFFEVYGIIVFIVSSYIAFFKKEGDVNDTD